MRTLTVRFLGAATLAGSLVLGLAAARERQAGDIYGAAPEAAARVLSVLALNPNLSYNTAREALTRCVTTITSKYFEGLADAEKSNLVLNCRDFARELVERNAPHAEAHILLALLGDDARDADAVRENLAAAQKLAPRDRFNVEWRLILAHRASQWSGAIPTGYDCARDLQLLETHLPGNRTLAFLRGNNARLLERCAA